MRFERLEAFAASDVSFYRCRINGAFYRVGDPVLSSESDFVPRDLSRWLRFELLPCLLNGSCCCHIFMCVSRRCSPLFCFEFVSYFLVTFLHFRQCGEVLRYRYRQYSKLSRGSCNSVRMRRVECAQGLWRLGFLCFCLGYFSYRLWRLVDVRSVDTLCSRLLRKVVRG